VFLTTHNLAEAERLCGQVAVIRQGRLVAQGSPEALRARRGARRLEVLGRGFTEEVLAGVRARPDVVRAERRDERLVVEMRPSAESAPVVSQLVSAGAEVEEVRKGNATLEEVFLTLMEEEA